MQNCTLYTYSERAWQQCALFQNASAALLQRTGYQGNFSSIGQSCLRVYNTWALHSSITDLATNQTGASCSPGKQNAEVTLLQGSGATPLCLTEVCACLEVPASAIWRQVGLKDDICTATCKSCLAGSQQYTTAMRCKSSCRLKMPVLLLAVGAAQINSTALQVICQPDPFLGALTPSPAGVLLWETSFTA